MIILTESKSFFSKTPKISFIAEKIVHTAERKNSPGDWNWLESV